MNYQSQAPVKFQWSLDIDLQADYSSAVYARLKRAGYTDADKKYAVYQYYNLLKRQIEPKPRKVMYSKEFQCPKEYQVALKAFEERAQNGLSLAPFQSEKIKRANYNDMLLNDWGIQHFHLSRRYRDDGFVARSQYQIFAYVTDEAMYMIQIVPHNEEDLYSRREMVRIIRDNWPNLLKRFHFKGVTGLTEKLDDHAYGEIRNANITTLLELGENEVYGMIGGGYASNGFSIESLRKADFWINTLGVFQLIVKDNAEWLGKTINQMLGREEQFCNMAIKLLWIDNKDNVTMCETASSLILQADIKENRLRVCRPHDVLGVWLDSRNRFL